MPTFWITGIDTDIGKTEAVGHIAAWLSNNKYRVITFKPVQTGCPNQQPEDILKHREIMGIEPYSEDNAGLTCPFIYTLPAAPVLAARQDGSEIDPAIIHNNLSLLQQQYDFVLVEGAGGLRVPMTETLEFIDILEAAKDPVILVTSPKLGSVNHTLLSLEALASRKIQLAGLVYNRYFSADPIIEKDSKRCFLKELKKLGYPPVIIDLPISSNKNQPADFRQLLQSSF